MTEKFQNLLFRLNDRVVENCGTSKMINFHGSICGKKIPVKIEIIKSDSRCKINERTNGNLENLTLNRQSYITRVLNLFQSENRPGYRIAARELISTKGTIGTIGIST